jgi:hypothetical protein
MSRPLLALIALASLLVAAPAHAADDKGKIVDFKTGKPFKGSIRAPTKAELTEVDIVPKDDPSVELAPLMKKGKKGKKGKDEPEEILVDGRPLSEENAPLGSGKRDDEELYVDEAAPSFEEVEAARARKEAETEAAGETAAEATAVDGKFRRR